MPRTKVVRHGNPPPVQPPVADPLDEGPEVIDSAEATEAAAVKTPSDWRKGALLNVRNYGDAYVVTLYPEELDNERPERSLRFTNVGLCQDFVSNWYARESHDPRAR